jgi:uncharacterized protein HemY
MQTSLYQQLIAPRLPLMMPENPVHCVSKYSAVEIRETISRLVAEERMDLANALGQAGLALYPNSEDILAIAGLLAMLRSDWEEAVSLLNDLLVLQGDAAPITTHLMFIRSLRSAGEPAAALKAVMLAHEHHRNHPELEAAFESISAQMGLKSA